MVVGSVGLVTRDGVEDALGGTNKAAAQNKERGFYYDFKNPPIKKTSVSGSHESGTKKKTKNFGLHGPNQHPISKGYGVEFVSRVCEIGAKRGGEGMGNAPKWSVTMSKSAYTSSRSYCPSEVGVKGVVQAAGLCCDTEVPSPLATGASEEPAAEPWLHCALLSRERSFITFHTTTTSCGEWRKLAAAKVSRAPAAALEPKWQRLKTPDAW